MLLEDCYSKDLSKIWDGPGNCAIATGFIIPDNVVESFFTCVHTNLGST